jgi:hypothetical protein
MCLFLLIGIKNVDKTNKIWVIIIEKNDYFIGSFVSSVNNWFISVIFPRFSFGVSSSAF